MKKILSLIIVLTFAGFCCSDDDSDDSSCRRSPAISTENALKTFNFTPLAGADFTVMSRNLYLGGDISLILSASGPAEIFQNTGIVFDNVVDSEFPRRAEGIAREIEQINPDIIALQEVVTIFTGDPDFTQNLEKNAGCVEFDFLEILTAALTRRGLSYKTAASNINSDIELTDTTKDIRLTDSDVILVKSDISVTSQISAAYSVNYTVNFSGIIFEIKRGYCEAVLVINGKSVTVINTHPEVQEVDGGVTNEAQVNELKSHIESDIPASMPVIIAGDFNSGPNDVSQSQNAYDNMMSLAGINDSWDEVYSGSLQYTCCYAADLTGDPGDLSYRIDHIFYRDGSSVNLGAADAMVTEQDSGEKIIKTDAAEIWPSDHAGIAAGFSFQ